MKKIIISFIVLAGLLSAGTHAELAVIVAPSTNIDSINIEQLQRLYLNRANRFPNGVRLLPVDQKTGSPQQLEFARKALGKSATELSKYWSRRMFSGKGHPPRQYKDDSAVMQQVAGSENLIGYVDTASVDDSVKIILQIP
ncbi:MAG TPA: phosphate ABC transporter substrate-binding protein [Gammaproteobacteria bacterium]|nr:phosphate ABC transporter substrate-binding protein [Gammaproteobacteria bacterium]